MISTRVMANSCAVALSLTVACGTARALSGTERQITSDPGGHILTNLNVFSPDSAWIVYDERSDQEGAAFDSKFIKRVDVKTGAIETLYEARNGAFVGVVTYNPARDSVVFIHGPEHPTTEWSYAGHHREGSVVDVSQPGIATNLDARDIVAPFTPGALRGGTHVHIYEPSGDWLSFTYQDHVMNVLGAAGDHDLDQRNVGVSAPLRPVKAGHANLRNRDGARFTVLVTRTVNAPKPGSDEINRAYEEGWIGRNGYVRADGARQRHALAFLGDTIDATGKQVTEVFVADLPEDLTQSDPAQPIEGTATRLPAPPKGVVQRRVTFTADRKNPGIQGPRFWGRSSSDGASLAFLMKDDAGNVQIFSVSPNGGEIRQLTHNAFSVGSTISWSPDGHYVAYVGDDSVFVTEAATGNTTRVAPKDPTRPVLDLAADFSPDGRSIAYERVVTGSAEKWDQIFVTDLAK